MCPAGFQARAGRRRHSQTRDQDEPGKKCWKHAMGNLPAKTAFVSRWKPRPYCGRCRSTPNAPSPNSRNCAPSPPTPTARNAWRIPRLGPMPAVGCAKSSRPCPAWKFIRTPPETCGRRCTARRNVPCFSAAIWIPYPTAGGSTAASMCSRAWKSCAVCTRNLTDSRL